MSAERVTFTPARNLHRPNFLAFIQMTWHTHLKNNVLLQAFRWLSQFALTAIFSRINGLQSCSVLAWIPTRGWLWLRFGDMRDRSFHYNHRRVVLWFSYVSFVWRFSLHTRVLWHGLQFSKRLVSVIYYRRSNLLFLWLLLVRTLLHKLHKRRGHSRLYLGFWAPFFVLFSKS